MLPSTIATLGLLVSILLVLMFNIPEVLMIVTIMSLFFGFINLLMFAPLIGGWYLFFSILWELVWILIPCIIPSQKKLWNTPLN